jgi:hypothetical protein
MFPAIRLAVREYHDGCENEALRIHFVEPLTPLKAGIVMGGVAELISWSQYILEPSFPEQGIVDHIVIQPRSGQGKLSPDDYSAMVRHLGFEPNGELPLVAPGQPPFPEEALQGEGHQVIAPHPAWPQ